jgi:hypothetical protein
MVELDDALLGIIEDLIETVELRDSADGDVPRWETEARIRRLESQLREHYRVADRRPAPATLDTALAGVF